MSEQTTLVKLTKDVYPFGCKGDVRPFTADELAELKAKVVLLGLDHAFETPNVADAKADEDSAKAAARKKTGVAKTDASTDATAKAGDGKDAASTKK